MHIDNAVDSNPTVVCTLSGGLITHTRSVRPGIYTVCTNTCTRLLDEVSDWDKTYYNAESQEAITNNKLMEHTDSLNYDYDSVHAERML